MDATSRQLVYEWCTFQRSEHAKGRPFTCEPTDACSPLSAWLSREIKCTLPIFVASPVSFTNSAVALSDVEAEEQAVHARLRARGCGSNSDRKRRHRALTASRRTDRCMNCRQSESWSAGPKRKYLVRTRTCASSEAVRLQTPTPIRPNEQYSLTAREWREHSDRVVGKRLDIDVRV